MRSVKRLTALLLALCLLAGCAFAEDVGGPELSADGQIGQEQGEQPAGSEPTEPSAPGQVGGLDQPAAPEEPVEPDEPATPAEPGQPSEPAAPPVAAAPAQPAWDESQCQHNTPECEQAPTCEVPGCGHITQDAHGLDIPVCELGLWLLGAQDAPGIMTLSVRANVIDLNVADATIYRSGSYRVTGGNLRPGASLRVAKNRVVVLQLTDTTIGELTVENGSQLHIETQGQNALESLIPTGKNEIVFAKGGAMTIKAVKELPENSDVTFEVKGGSVQASLVEKNGLVCYGFDGQGAQSVAVDGLAYPATPDKAGAFYLWLPVPEEGMKWTAETKEDLLRVIKAANLPQETLAEIIPGVENALQANTTYVLRGEVPEGTLLTIAENGVTVALEDAQSTGTLINASAAYTLHVTGENTVDTLQGGSVTLQGDGKLTVNGALPANAAFRSGRYVLANPPAGYAAYAVGYPLENQTVTLDGVESPMLTSASGALLLPIPAKGKTYAITADEETVTVRTADEGELAFILTEAHPTADADDATTFTVAGDGTFVTGVIAASGATANASFQNVRLQGNDALLNLNNEHLTVTLTGDNTLQSASGKAIALAGDSSVVLNAASGRLALLGQNDLTGITLQGNILVEPATSEPHLSLLVRDQNGNPVPNKAMTVSIGGNAMQYITHYDGSLHLWGLGDVSGQEIAATDGENVYTAVVVDNQAQVTTGLTDFSDVTFTNQADGSVLVNWTVTGAGTTGIQVLHGPEAIDMPDTYVPEATRLIQQGNAGVCIAGVPDGDVITVRVFATQAEGAELNEESADGFQFGEIQTYQRRPAWKYNGHTGDADADYTGKAYVPVIKLPANAEITYTGKGLVNGKPVEPGDYVMKVTIPEGDPTYQAGTTEIPFTIHKLVATIEPGNNLQKYKYRDDPEFTWTVKGLLSGDTVTGQLTREPGEEVGEYAWRTNGFFAPEYYELRIAPNAQPFVILPLAPMGGMWVDEIMNPVQQTIMLQDGRKLSVTLTAQESLTVTHSVLGNLVRNENDENRLMTPQLSWNAENDEVLLMLRAEPEMSIDHGYQTDSMGNVLWGERRMRLSGNGLDHMKRMGITALTLINKNASITCRVEDFLSDEIAQAVKDMGGQMNSAVFYLKVEPVQESPDGIRPVTDGWRMGAVLKVGNQEMDVTPMLPSLIAAVDMEPIAELLSNMNRYDEETFPTQFALSMEDGTALETTFVEPFEEDELQKASFPNMMYINRYAFAPLTASGTVYAVNAPGTEDVTAEAE